MPKKKLDLSGFIGTTEYHPSSFGMLNLTDGVDYLRREGEAFWLVDKIESHQPDIGKSTPFQSWRLKKTGNHSAILECQDGDYHPCVDFRGKKLKPEKIEITDIWENTGLNEIRFFLYNKTLMLRSEY